MLIFRLVSGKLETRCHHNLGTKRTSPGFKITRVATVCDVFGYLSLNSPGDKLESIILNRLLNCSFPSLPSFWYKYFVSSGEKRRISFCPHIWQIKLSFLSKWSWDLVGEPPNQRIFAMEYCESSWINGHDRVLKSLLKTGKTTSKGQLCCWR